MKKHSTTTTKPKFIVIDVETTGTDWKTDKLHGLGVAYEEDETEYIMAGDITSHPVLYDLLVDPGVAKVGHNIKFDIKFLVNSGIDVAGSLYDTMEIAQLVDENSSVGLKQLAEAHLGLSATEEKRDLDRVCSLAGARHVGELCAIDLKTGEHTDIIARYCQEDCNNTYRLFYVLTKQLRRVDSAWKKLGAKKGPYDYFKEEMAPLNDIILEMEMSGIAVDNKRIVETKCQIEEEIKNALIDLANIASPYVKQVEDDLYVAALAKRKSEKGRAKVERGSDRYKTAFNWQSGDHLSELIYNKLRVPKRLIKYTKSGAPSTNDTDLKSLRKAVGDRSPVLSGILDALSRYKKLCKLSNTYVGSESGLLSHVVNNRIFASYHQAASSKDGGKGGTLTGRLSSQHPNMQNLPRGGTVKRFFVPDRDNVFLYFDYSQLELRLAAYLSNDPELSSAYERSLDLHALTASAIFNIPVDRVTKEQRQVGKTINFAMIYDASAYRLTEELNRGGAHYSIEQVEAMRKAFFKKYSRYREYLYEQRDLLESRQALISEYGRVRRLPEIKYKEGLDWARRRYTGPATLLNALKHRPDEALSEEEIFSRAKRKAQHALKQAYNFPIQSLGASITKRAMIQLHRAGFKVVTQVHDSIVLQVKEKWAQEALKKAGQIMEGVVDLNGIPLKAEGKILRSLDESDLWTQTTKETKNEVRRHG